MKIKRQVSEIIQADRKRRAEDQNERESSCRPGRKQRCLGHKPKYFIRFSLLLIPGKLPLATAKDRLAQPAQTCKSENSRDKNIQAPQGRWRVEEQRPE